MGSSTRMNAKSRESSQHYPLNAFTVDVEGFVESNVQSFYIPSRYINRSEENREIERNVDVLLETLDRTRTKGTFFFVGRLAKEIPGLIRKVSEAGHEVGCHNYQHIRVFDVHRDEFRDKLRAAKENLEDVSGQPVYGFRAPDFSITKTSIWAIDVLKEIGFLYDSSIYPLSLHDVYGIKDAEPTIHTFPNGLIEFPMSTVEILGKRVPFGGGGYFRLYPLWLTRLFITTLNKQGVPCIFYIHPYEVGPAIPKIPQMSAYRKFRHYYNCNKGKKRIVKLLKDIRFGCVLDVLKNSLFIDITRP
jgi:polysaccharide deacetylase family protein (PEP-CTERM system associated)